ncbi:uncharacterized protein PFLUO_LOCUS1225 [Penicillium psychrofluorescens]|uniref:uncharacterized protein n=1 Tax=Penicillium psychrofluorescens TaxID=3158075 RepID=UPI003CCCF8F5
MSELRQRPVASNQSHDTHAGAPTQRRRGSSSASSASSASSKSERDHDQDPVISVLDLIRVALALVVASCGLSYYMTSGESMLWGHRPWYTRWPVVVQWVRGPLSLTPPQLSLYNGSDRTLPIYLAVNGTVFDVSANPVVYGPGGSYNFFAGRDATRAFVTGCFKEDLTPDLRGVEEMFVPVDDVEELSSAQRKIRREKELREARASVEKTVRRWDGFFRNHKKYFPVGKVVVDTEEAEGETTRTLCESAQKQRPKRSQVDKNKNKGSP